MDGKTDLMGREKQKLTKPYLLCAVDEQPENPTKFRNLKLSLQLEIERFESCSSQKTA